MIAYFSRGTSFFIQAETEQNNLLVILGTTVDGVPFQEQLAIPVREHKKIKFRPGDVFISSDNQLQWMSGIIGHAGIVINDTYLIESRGGRPAIVKDVISRFELRHTDYAVFRPKNQAIGEAAAKYAEEYHKQYQKNIMEEIFEPEYSINPTQDLLDPWTFIYCSKLVWLAFYYGATYEIKHGQFWISPRNLYVELSESSDFEKIYEQGVNFYLA